MIEWNIQARSHACQACHRHFADKEPFHTLLFDEKQAYARYDVCQDCWTTQFSQGATDRKGFVSYWQGLYAAPPAAPPDPIHRQTAETLLRQLIQQNDPSHAGARFILAVMLERKRLLKVKAQIVEGSQRMFIYEHAQSGDIFHIPDPNLQLDQLEEVQRDVARLLTQGISRPESPSNSPVAMAGDAGESQPPPPAQTPPESQIQPGPEAAQSSEIAPPPACSPAGRP